MEYGFHAAMDAIINIICNFGREYKSFAENVCVSCARSINQHVRWSFDGLYLNKSKHSACLLGYRNFLCELLLRIDETANSQHSITANAKAKAMKSMP